MLTVEEAFATAGFPVTPGTPIYYSENCGYWELHPETDNGGLYWWSDTGPFFDTNGWNAEANEDMMRSFDGGSIPLNRLPAADCFSDFPFVVQVAIRTFVGQ